MAGTIWYDCNISKEFDYHESITTVIVRIDDGSCNEIYTGAAPECVIGLTFGQAALVKNNRSSLQVMSMFNNFL